MDITALPFNRLIGLERATAGGTLLALPNDVRYTNHLGTVHASALLALAEATSGEYLLSQVSEIDFAVLPVVRRVEAKFRKPARGAVSSRAHVAPEMRDEFVTTLRTRGRALIEIGVDVHDEHGTHALTATIEWFVARQD